MCYYWSPAAIRSFGDDRTMRIFNGDAVAEPPAPLRPRLQRLMRSIHAAPDLTALRGIPTLTGATLGEGLCTVDIVPHWKLTFRWHDEDAWNVRLEAQ
jgi:plasmid maintenance system killer protein